jgi:hypothetical protein
MIKDVHVPLLQSKSADNVMSETLFEFAEVCKKMDSRFL